MDSFSLNIRAVYSKLAPQTESDKFTTAIRLGQHQLDTLNAYNNPDIEIIFNTAMTGDGKTLAAYLPAFLGGKRAVASYPTNELIRDQCRSVSTRLAQFNYKGNLREMHGEEITRLMEESGENTRAEEVKRLIGDTDLLLTNPDLFHLLMSDHYGWFQRREFSQRLQANFHYYIFDEFHIFGPPQVIAVMNIINAVAVERRKNPAERRRKFIFLSATPDPLMKKMLQATGLRYTEIEGQYSDTPQPDSRRILAPCTLNFTAVSRENGGIEGWVLNHLDELITFYRTYPGSKGALIVNSVAVARRLVKAIEKSFWEAGLSVGENTGLTGKEIRAESFNKDLLVGTSTVDIGVDFQINLLLFEAMSSADFLQRFGRLGRHTNYIKDGRKIQFMPESYRAYAFCPRFICERIAKKVGLVDEKGETGLYDPNSSLSRPIFSQEIIAEVFPDRQQFRLYAHRWGLLQAAHFVVNLERPKYADDNYKELREDLVQQFAKSFGAKTTGLVWQKATEYKKLNSEEKTRTLIDEINSFRGTSLSCGVWDTTDNQLKTYGLLYILANSQFEVISEEAFMTEAKRRGESEYRYRYQLLYLKVTEYLPESESFIFKIAALNLAKEHRVMLNHAEAVKGFIVQDLSRANLGEVNAILKKQRLVCTMTSEWNKPADLKRVLNLSPLIQVHSLSDSVGTNYCVAFGKAALLLDSLLYWRKNQSDPEFYLY